MNLKATLYLGPMNRFILLFCLAAMACTGSLTREQREKIRENQRLGAIQKVGEAELLEGALMLGRTVAGAMETDPAKKTELEKEHRVRIAGFSSGQPGLSEKEKQLLEAYMAGNPGGDNIQKLGDTILYTKPVTRERPDGSTEFMRAVAVYIPVKEIVLFLGKQEK